MNGRPLPVWFKFVVPPLFALLCGGIVYGALIHPYRRAADAASWPAVPCVILESKVQNIERSRTLFEPLVRYRYLIGGQDYESDRIWFAGDVSQQGEQPSREAIRPYPSGSQTTCRVNPENPADSVLDPVLRGPIPWILGGCFGTGVAISLAGTVLAYRPRRPAPPGS